MAIAKNTAKAAESKAETKTTKPAAKAASKTVAKSAPVEVEKAATTKVSRKDIALALQEKVKATGKAVPLGIAETMVVAYEEVIQEALASGAEVNLPGFGKFFVKAVQEQNRPNPQKPGEKITVKAHNAPKFKIGSKLKAAVNGGEEVGEEE